MKNIILAGALGCVYFFIFINVWSLTYSYSVNKPIQGQTRAEFMQEQGIKKGSHKHLKIDPDYSAEGSFVLENRIHKKVFICTAVEYDSARKVYLFTCGSLNMSGITDEPKRKSVHKL